MTNVDWAARQRDVHDRLSRIKARESAHVIDGKDFDLAELISAEAELELLRAAEGEDQRRLEAEEAKHRDARITALRSEIRDLIADRGEIIDAAEDAAAAFVGQLAALLKNGDEIDRRLKLLGLHASQALAPTSVKITIGYRLCRLLWPVVGRSLGCIPVRSLGGKTLPDGSKVEESWRESDSRMNNFRAVMKGQKR